MAKWMTHPKGGVMKMENSMQEESCKLHGWTYCDGPSPKQATASEPEFILEPEASPTADVEELSLEERAQLVGLKVDRRWSDARLQREVEAAEAINDMLE